MGFDNLRHQIEDADHLYRVFEAHRVRLLNEAGWRLLAAIVLLAAGLLLPGAWALTALCLALPAALACMSSMVEYSGCGWFLQLVTLHDVIRPREPVLRFDVDPAPYREDTRPAR
jgi:hypothetical protein